MIVLFTDYGWQDPYVAQLKAVLHAEAASMPVLDLLHSVPDYNAHAAAHLLAAMTPAFPQGTVMLAVVDPGVGGPRAGVVVEADGRYFVGPDNGLLSIVAGRATTSRSWRIVWHPEKASATFHGRDIYAPIAAAIANGNWPAERLENARPEVVFDLADLPRILYIDHYGNAWTGLRGSLADPGDALLAGGVTLPWRRTFCEAEKGEAFWHVNANGLVEIAANRALAAQLLGLEVGTPVRFATKSRCPLH